MKIIPSDRIIKILEKYKRKLHKERKAMEDSEINDYLIQAILDYLDEEYKKVLTPINKELWKVGFVKSIIRIRNVEFRTVIVQEVPLIVDIATKREEEISAQNIEKKSNVKED